MCSNFFLLSTILAAKFCTCCNLATFLLVVFDQTVELKYNLLKTSELRIVENVSENCVPKSHSVYVDF